MPRYPSRLATFTAHLTSLGWLIESAVESTSDEPRLEVVARKRGRRLRLIDSLEPTGEERLWWLDLVLLGPGGREIVSEYDGERASIQVVLGALDEADEWAGQ